MSCFATIDLKKQKMIQALEYLSIMLGEALCSIEDYAKCIYQENLKKEKSKQNKLQNKNKDKAQSKELDKIPNLTLHYQKYNNFNAGNTMNKIELRNRVIYKIRNFSGGIEGYQKLFQQAYTYPEEFFSTDMTYIKYYLNILKDDINIVSYIKESFGIYEEEPKNNKHNIEEICVKEVKDYESSLGTSSNPSTQFYMKYCPTICNQANNIGKNAIEKLKENPNYQPKLDRDKPAEENIYYNNLSIQTFNHDYNSTNTKKRPSGDYDYI